MYDDDDDDDDDKVLQWTEYKNVFETRPRVTALVKCSQNTTFLNFAYALCYLCSVVYSVVFQPTLFYGPLLPELKLSDYM